MIIAGPAPQDRTWHGVPIGPPPRPPVEAPLQDRVEVGAGSFARGAWTAAGIAGVVSAVSTTAAMAAFMATGPGPAQALLEPIARFSAWGCVAAGGAGLVSGMFSGVSSDLPASKAWKVARTLGVASAVGSLLTPATFGTPAFMPMSLGTLAVAGLATGAAGVAAVSSLVARGEQAPA